ncbi:hypothetical protein CRG98_047759, partial [Punica granatum]
DFIFNCGGLSVAFVFVPTWDRNNLLTIFNRVRKLREQFAHFYVALTLPTKEQNESFVRSYFKPTFVPVQDLEIGFEKIVKIALSLGVCKQQDAISKLKAERRQLVQRMHVFNGVVTDILHIDDHDANALNQAIGSIEAIAKASKQCILENTDLSEEKADILKRFFRDPKFYLSPKISGASPYSDQVHDFLRIKRSHQNRPLPRGGHAPLPHHPILTIHLSSHPTASGPPCSTI